MATFNGTNANEIITGAFVSPSVIAVGGTLPSNAADTIDGGAGNDTIDGVGGDDLLLGGDGDDLLTGGRGNDTVIGGKGTDTAVLGSGNDVFIWNQGEGSDTVEGNSGFDTMVFNGAVLSEDISISANGDGARLFRGLGNITMDVHSVERIEVTPLGGADTVTINDLTGTHVREVAVDLGLAGVGDTLADAVTVNGTAGNNHINVTTTGTMVTVSGLTEKVTVDHADAGDLLTINGGDGKDTIDASALPAGMVTLTLDGGDGNDILFGGHGADMLFGGAGNDTVTGGAGIDVASLGTGNDKFIWNNGDGSDIVEGEDGFDTMVFNGGAGGENITISANGVRSVLFRTQGNITMDMNSVERIEVAPLGAADTITVNDMTGADVKEVAINLAGPGTTLGDSQPDQVLVNGTAGDDAITIDRSHGAIRVSGLAATTTITHAEGALDQLTVSGGAGNDTIDASKLTAGNINLVINGDAGNDVIHGSHGNDVVIGGTGTDVATLGDGDDLFIWNQGDGSDTVLGQDGFDTMLFNGAPITEDITISTTNDGATLFRTQGNITMDLHGVERIEVAPFGGQDHITVNDLAGSGVKEVAIDLATSTGSDFSDGQTDTVTVNGTANDDVINITADNSGVLVNGLSEDVTIAHADATDVLTINGGDGNDTIDASTVAAGTMAFILRGGDGNDTLAGGGGNDTFAFTAGETGHDVVQNFEVHGAGPQGDTVLLKGFADATFDQAVTAGHIAQFGTDVHITDGANLVATLEDVSLASLHAQDFLFV
jgi:Ca2+-binding RTX toxin-like protein